MPKSLRKWRESCTAMPLRECWRPLYCVLVGELKCQHGAPFLLQFIRPFSQILTWHCLIHNRFILVMRTESADIMTHLRHDSEKLCFISATVLVSECQRQHEAKKWLKKPPYITEHRMVSKYVVNSRKAVRYIALASIYTIQMWLMKKEAHIPWKPIEIVRKATPDNVINDVVQK